MTNGPTVSVDLLDPATFRDGPPYDLLRRLRDEDPVHWQDEVGGPGYWIVSRHADIRQVERDYRHYSNEARGPLIYEPTESELANYRLLLVGMDPPKHTRFRLLVNRAFTPMSIEKLEPMVSRITDELVEGVAGRDRCDVVADLADPLPAWVMCGLLGVPSADRELVTRLAKLRMSYFDPSVNPAGRSWEDVQGEILDYAGSLLARKRHDPGDGIVDILLASEIDGERLQDEELRHFFLLLLVAGIDTTSNGLGTAIQVLVEHPDEVERLRRSPSLLTSAVEELLRLATPTMHFRRTATEDTELAGTHIAAGDKVVLLYVSGNRDERVFSAPDQVRIDRSPNPHLTFGGGGPHFCLGAHLARMEMGSLIGRLLSRRGTMRPDGKSRRLVSNLVNGLTYLPVTWSSSNDNISTAKPSAIKRIA